MGHKADCAFVLNFETACTCGAASKDRVETGRNEGYAEALGRLAGVKTKERRSFEMRSLVDDRDLLGLGLALGRMEEYIDNAHNGYRNEDKCLDCGECICAETCIENNKDQCVACECAHYFDEAESALQRIKDAYNNS